MTTRQIVVIDPATRVPELSDFNQISMLSPISCTYHMPGLQGLASFPAVTADIAGIVILGSSANPNQSLPWQSQLAKWLEPCLVRRIPILGCCYGHQLIAAMMGGAVSLHPEAKAKAQGVRQVTLHPHPLAPAGGEAVLVVSHRDEVTRAPRSSLRIGTSIGCEMDALYYPEHFIWTYQAHPEATQGFLDHQEIQLSAAERLEAFSCGRGIVQAFLDWCGPSKKI